MKNIYIVLSQTGSIVSKILKKITKDKYNHVSICLDENINEMYSFGRVFTHNPFLGGFVKENLTKGTFLRFRKSDIAIIKLEIEDEKYFEIKTEIENMYLNRKKYHYSYIGLFFAFFRKSFHRKYCYYCSEFVKSILTKFNLIFNINMKDVIRPVEFLGLTNGEVVFTGKLNRFVNMRNYIFIDNVLSDNKINYIGSKKTSSLIESIDSQYIDDQQFVSELRN